MKALTTNKELSGHLGALLTHARLVSFGVSPEISSKALFMDMREQELADSEQKSRQSSFERLSETLLLNH
jgi:hypothetical protein